MRLGGPIFGKPASPAEWVAAVREAGYRAAYCPVPLEADDATVDAYAAAARAADIVIAEVGAWSNPLSPDDAIRLPALAKCQRALALADRIGARCAVNIVGSRGAKWDGPCAEDLTPATFDLIVASVREIVDAVRPRRAVYTLETMPWMYPDSADSYLALLKAIDRPGQVACHLDPVNLVCSPQRYFRNADLLRECFAKLGPLIVGCHAKDILLQPKLTTHLDEVRPGLGQLDYRVYLRELAKLDPDTPLMLEHLKTAEEYALAAAHVRQVAAAEGLTL
jgi:sugar phosphate isomerase/epimerase